MSEVLPRTTARMLEEELEKVLGVKAIEHDWSFVTADIVSKVEFLKALRQSARPYPALYAIVQASPLASPQGQLDLMSPAELSALLNELTSQKLLDPAILSAQWLSSTVLDCYAQVRREGHDPKEVQRVNRMILEELFPRELRSADERHLRTTLQRLSKEKPKALCISGGGIRSATFALGVLQGLARTGPGGGSPLDEIHYLSSVSGGGFVGGWLSAWIHRSAGSTASVFRQLRPSAPADARPTAHEPEPIRWLRNYSNYLAPRFSMFSVDTWTLIATWLRNVAINWLVFLPLLAVLLALPRLLVSLVAAGDGNPTILFSLAMLLATTSIATAALSEPSARLNRSPLRHWGIVATRVTILLAALVFTLLWASLGYDNASLWIFIFAGIAIEVLGAIAAAILSGQPGRRRNLPLMSLTAAVFGGVTGGVALQLATRLAGITSVHQRPELYSILAPVLFMLAFLLAATVFTTVSSWITGDEIREYWSRIGASLLVAVFAFMVIAAVSFYGPIVLSFWPKAIGALGGISGIVGIVVGSSGLSPATERADRGRPLSDWVTAIAIPLFILVLLSCISWGVSSALQLWWPGEFPATRWPSGGLTPAALDHLCVVRETRAAAIGEFLAISAFLAALASFFVDVNKFSMHGLYRMRLVRAYLGASNFQRKGDPFTGFDPEDNLVLSELAGFPPRKPQKPFHIINMAINLVRGRRLAWQQRKAASFTASPLHCGNWMLGYRPTEDYGKPGTGLDLGTAMTISGAAASPNMGYHSSPALTFLLAMFNVRLGAWLGNPGPAGARLNAFDRLFHRIPAWMRKSPRASLYHQLAEAFGWTDDEHQYVYLSDGGHFENLGLYEMVLRRCSHIIIADAGQDPNLELEDLGNAVRKIRIDWGIPIEFSRFSLLSRAEKQPGAHCAIGQIRYSAVDGTVEDGLLLYIKATYYAQGPQDLRQYARKAKAFPHESTADQFFSESQFESYRKLGEWVVETILENKRPATMRELFLAATKYAAGQPEVVRW